jgi:hypothetical protein
MSFLNLSSDIIKDIISLLEDISRSRLVRTCKDLYIHGKVHGFVSFINADLHTNMMTFIQRFCQHSHTMKSVDIQGLDNPHLWLPHYVERLYFNHCSITNYINPGSRTNSHVVKVIKLTDYHRYKLKTVVHINWNCFPNLEELELYCYDVHINGLEKLKKLKRINIDTTVRGKINRI